MLLPERYLFFRDAKLLSINLKNIHCLENKSMAEWRNASTSGDGCLWTGQSRTQNLENPQMEMFRSGREDVCATEVGLTHAYRKGGNQWANAVRQNEELSARGESEKIAKRFRLVCRRPKHRTTRDWLRRDRHCEILDPRRRLHLTARARTPKLAIPDPTDLVAPKPGLMAASRGIPFVG